MAAIGYINKLESFGLVDGPGVRFVIFLQGCHMRCQYCHNPEMWTMKSEEVTEWTPQALFDRVHRYKNYWRGNGGVTVSGGEPLLQIDFIVEFFKICKKNGVDTCLDTSGSPFTREQPFFSKFEELMKYTDLVMLDLKHMHAEQHKALTAQHNANILDMARYLSDNGVDMWIRRVLVPNISDDPTELQELKDFIDSLKTVKRVEVLPYHTLGITKYEKLNIPYALDGVEMPTAEQKKKAEIILGIHKPEEEAPATLTNEHADRLLRGCN